MPLVACHCKSIKHKNPTSTLSITYPWIGNPSTVLATEVSAMEGGRTLLEDSLVILPGLESVEWLVILYTGGRIKVELAGIPSDPDLAVPDTTSSGLTLIDLLSTLIEVCSDDWVPDAPAPTVEVLITLGVITVEIGDKFREGIKVVAVSLRLVGLATLAVALLDSKVSTLESVYPLSEPRVSLGSGVTSDA